MASANQTRFRNQLLAALPPDEQVLLGRSLVPVDMPRRMQLEQPNRKITQVYFMESGIASIVASAKSGTQVEVGIIGREGVTGLPIIHLADRFPYAVYMQVEGKGLKLEASALLECMERSLEARRVFLAFAQSFLLQTMETAVANARGNMGERLARWLLMAQDRIGGDEIPLTHEFLSMMMGARRPGVTEAIHELAGQGLVRGARGKITVTNRAGLEQHAGRYYGAPEKELRRLLG